MLADFTLLSNDMKIAAHKNNLQGQIWYKSLDPVGVNTVFWTTFFRKFWLEFRPTLQGSQPLG